MLEMNKKFNQKTGSSNYSNRGIIEVMRMEFKYLYNLILMIQLQLANKLKLYYVE